MTPAGLYHPTTPAASWAAFRRGGRSSSIWPSSPTSSIAQPRRSVDRRANAVEVATEGRHDPCVGIRATPIAEAMLALVLMDYACATAPSAATWPVRRRAFQPAKIDVESRAAFPPGAGVVAEGNMQVDHHDLIRISGHARRHRRAEAVGNAHFAKFLRPTIADRQGSKIWKEHDMPVSDFHRKT